MKAAALFGGMHTYMQGKHPLFLELHTYLDEHAWMSTQSGCTTSRSKTFNASLQHNTKHRCLHAGTAKAKKEKDKTKTDKCNYIHPAKLSSIGVRLSKSKVLSKHRLWYFFGLKFLSLDTGWIYAHICLSPGYHVILNLLPICRTNICPNAKQILFSNIIYFFLYCK